MTNIIRYLQVPNREHITQKCGNHLHILPSILFPSLSPTKGIYSGAMLFKNESGLFCELAWPSGEASDWGTEGPRFNSASVLFSFEMLWSVCIVM